MTRSAPRATQILVVLALINLVSYAARNALLDLYPQLAVRYGIDHAQIGWEREVFADCHDPAITDDDDAVLDNGRLLGV